MYLQYTFNHMYNVVYVQMHTQSVGHESIIKKTQ